LVAEQSLVAPGDIRLDAKPVEYGLDSLQVMEMAGRLEQEYNIQIPDAALASMSSLHDLVTYVGDACRPRVTGEATLVAALRRAAAGEKGVTFTDSAASTGERLAYRAWLERSGIVASALRARGVQPGGRVLICLPNSADFVITFFASMRAGAIPVAVSPAQGFGGDRALAPRLQKAAESVSAKWAIVGSRDAARAQSAGIAIFTPEELESEAAAPADLYEPAPDDIAYIQLTSGTTRAQRGALLSHAAVCANLRQIGEASGYSPDAIGYSWLPMFHDMGLGAVHVAMYHASEMFVTAPFSFLRSPVSWLKQISVRRVTHSPAPAFGFRHVLERLSARDLVGLDLSCWRAAYVGAEPISPNLVEEFNRRLQSCGLQAGVLQPCYGMAEATLAVTMRPRDQAARILSVSRSSLAREKLARTPTANDDAFSVVSCGPAIPGTEIRIVDEQRGELAEGRIGEIEIRGPSMFRGYWSAESGAGASGFFATGDLGFLHAGELYVTGRKKEIMILSGENHQPAAIEWTASRAAQGARVAALGIPDLQRGTEVLGLLVETNTPPDASTCAALVAELRRAVDEEFALAVAHVRFVPRRAIPLTTSGKIKRAPLLEIFRRAGLEPSEAVPPPRAERSLEGLGLSPDSE
jgi:acyl carrier protein